MKRNFLFLIFLASLSLPFAAFPPSAIATADTLYLSDIIKDARPDPAYAADGGKTRSDVLKNVIGAETWVEHFIADDTSIELLIYNRLVYGVIVREKGGETTYINWKNQGQRGGASWWRGFMGNRVRRRI